MANLSLGKMSWDCPVEGIGLNDMIHNVVWWIQESLLDPFFLNSEIWSRLYPVLGERTICQFKAKGLIFLWSEIGVLETVRVPWNREGDIVAG